MYRGRVGVEARPDYRRDDQRRGTYCVSRGCCAPYAAFMISSFLWTLESEHVSGRLWTWARTCDAFRELSRRSVCSKEASYRFLPLQPTSQVHHVAIDLR